MDIIKLIRIFLSVITMFCVIVLFHYTKWHFVKYYPVVINFCFFLLFFVTSFMKETIIQKFARLAKPGIKPKALDYTRKLTYIWAAFTFVNSLISLLTVFLPEKIWAIYNGFVSYLLVGSFFAIEYIVRIKFKRKYDC